MKTVSPGEAIAALKAGKVALVPTETVVGLVAAEPGLPRIREIKGRDANKPIALLCASAEEAFELAANVPLLARDLADLYWPGPLTLVLDLPSGGTIGVRVPAGKAVRTNLSGETATAVLDDVDPRVLESVDIVVEGEPGTGEASAVIDLSGGNVRLVRATRELSTQRLARLASE
jgi:L-threonylcarbamoyladenylate synthase